MIKVFVGHVQYDGVWVNELEVDSVDGTHVTLGGVQAKRATPHSFAADTRDRALDWIDEKIAAKKRAVIEKYEAGMKALRELEAKAEELRNE